LAPYNGGSINFYAVNFTQLQLAIKQLKQEAYTTLLSRACMMQIATLLMQREGGEALITGEALAQVASQTLQALNFTDRLTTPLVLRPCVGMDKEDIVGLARKIGSFTLSIEAETDCCSLFAPQHPIISPNYNTTLAIFKQGNFDELITQLADQTKAQLIVAN
jgi:thiamine biosynthesis protein ThiI